MKTSDLVGPALDWAVAKCEGVNAEAFCLYYEPTEVSDYDSHNYPEFHYSTIWAQGGPIIERERISIIKQDPPADNWWAFNEQQRPGDAFGPTLLVAAMRCYVASKLGDNVNIPKELT